MSSNAEELSAKLAALTKVREEKEARRKQEEEQERLEEELLQKELKRVEAEEKKKKAEEQRRCEAEEKQRKEEAKAALAAAEVKKRAETEKAGTGKRKDREELVGVIRTRMVDEKGLVWFAQEGVVCGSCEKSGERCMWRDSGSTRAKACRPCASMKKECPVPEARKAGVAKGNAESGPEAGPSKKRKVGPSKAKGKEKEREVSELEVGADASAALLAEVKGLREDTRELVTIGKSIHRFLKKLNLNLGFIAYHVEKEYGPGESGDEEEKRGVEKTGKVEGKEGGENAEGSGGAGGGGNAESENEVDGTLV
jgi:hypothetical protein